MSTNNTPPTLWIFEDQLSPRLSALAKNPDAPVLIIESDRAFRFVPYHKKRLVFLVSAMRHFVAELRAAGREVYHYPLRPGGRYLDSLSAIRDCVRRAGRTRFLVTEPSEWHTRAWIEGLPEKLGIEIERTPNDLFLTDRDEFAAWARAKKSPVMEIFYRKMRARHRVLMNGDEPIGGAFNFDKENRKPPPKSLKIPKIPAFAPDAITLEVMAEIERRFPDFPGTTAGFDLPVTRADAEAFFADFLERRLPLCGDYEDAMVTGEPVLFHSFISPLLNAGLLEPLACVRAAEERYHQGKAPLNAVEGFIRQILGWREYVYGIYWAFMPEYRERNARGASRSLPMLFWNGETDLNCLRQVIGAVLDRAYSHHIQRLMIISSFATLAGISPQAVNDWFLAMYVDSHDWVVTPNVIGMGMNADGGTMATKPYISSAAYIHRMSDYCKSCRYDHKARTGEDACPFNYLYWTFLQHFRAAYAKNPRLAMMLKNLDRVDPAEMREMMLLRKQFIEGLGGV